LKVDSYIFYFIDIFLISRRAKENKIKMLQRGSEFANFVREQQALGAAATVARRASEAKHTEKVRLFETRGRDVPVKEARLDLDEEQLLLYATSVDQRVEDELARVAEKRRIAAGLKTQLLRDQVAHHRPIVEVGRGLVHPHPNGRAMENIDGNGYGQDLLNKRNQGTRGEAGEERWSIKASDPRVVRTRDRLVASNTARGYTRSFPAFVSWMASEGYVGDPLLRDYSREERVLILTAFAEEAKSIFGLDHTERVMQGLRHYFEGHAQDTEYFESKMVLAARAPERGSAREKSVAKDANAKFPLSTDMYKAFHAKYWVIPFNAKDRTRGMVDQLMAFAASTLVIAHALRISEAAATRAEKKQKTTAKKSQAAPTKGVEELVEFNVVADPPPNKRADRGKVTQEVSHAVQTRDIMFEVTNDPPLLPTWVTAIEARRYGVEKALRMAIAYYSSKSNQFGGRSRKEILAHNRGAWEKVALQVLFNWNSISQSREEDNFFSRLYGEDNGYNRLQLQSKKVGEALKDIARNMPNAPPGFEKRFSPISLKKTAITWCKAAGMDQQNILRVGDHRTASSSRHYQLSASVCNAFDVMDYTDFNQDQLEVINNLHEAASNTNTYKPERRGKRK
jgi:hypothetical protein